jgi:hypothetical protein
MKRAAIWVVYVALWAWMFIDGGVGRLIAIVIAATLAVCGLAVYITKKILKAKS